VHKQILLRRNSKFGNNFKTVHLFFIIVKFAIRRHIHTYAKKLRRTYFRTGHVTDITSGHVTDVTSGHVTSGSTSQHLRKYGLSCAHILLTCLYAYVWICLLMANFTIIKNKWTVLKLLPNFEFLLSKICLCTNYNVN
jgi:hypothetical protein